MLCLGVAASASAGLRISTLPSQNPDSSSLVLFDVSSKDANSLPGILTSEPLPHGSGREPSQLYERDITNGIPSHIAGNGENCSIEQVQSSPASCGDGGDPRLAKLGTIQQAKPMSTGEILVQASTTDDRQCLHLLWLISRDRARIDLIFSGNGIQDISATQDGEILLRRVQGADSVMKLSRRDDGQGWNQSTCSWPRFCGGDVIALPHANEYLLSSPYYNALFKVSHEGADVKELFQGIYSGWGPGQSIALGKDGSIFYINRAGYLWHSDQEGKEQNPVIDPSIMGNSFKVRRLAVGANNMIFVQDDQGVIKIIERS